MKRTIEAVFVLFLVGLCAGVEAGTFQLESCDSTAGWGYAQGGVTVSDSATHQEGSGGLHVDIPAGAGGYRILRELPAGTWGASWTNYHGLRFRVRGDGSARWGIVTLYETDDWYRFYAPFPMTNGVWTEVTIPWREFVQRHWRGTIEETLDRIQLIGFERVSGYVPAQPPWPEWPAESFDVDDIRLVDGLVLPPTPIPAGTSLDNVRAKLAAQQPVKIVVIGTSFEWGLRLTDAVHDAYAAVLEDRLRQRYGYLDITVVNHGLRGADSYEGGHNLGLLAWEQEPADLLIVGGFYYNDASDIYDNSDFETVVIPGGPAQSADNFDRLFRTILRRGTMDVLFAPTALFAGNPGGLSNHVAAIRAKADALRIVTADVYGELAPLGANWLQTNYFTYYPTLGDTHPNAAGHARIAEIVRDAIVPANGPAPAARLLTLTPTADTWTDGDPDTARPDVNFGDDPFMHLYGQSGDTLIEGAIGDLLIRFHVPALATNTVVSNAVLRVYVLNDGQGDSTNRSTVVHVTGARKPWVEGDGTAGSGATHNTRDGTNAWAGGNINASEENYDPVPTDSYIRYGTQSWANTWVAFDVTPLVQDWIGGLRTNLGFVLVSNGKVDGLNNAPSEYNVATRESDHPPELWILYDPGPVPPGLILTVK